jgi:hypothetical protein
VAAEGRLWPENLMGLHTSRVVMCNLVSSVVSVPTKNRNEVATDKKPMNEMLVWPMRMCHSCTIH